MQFELSPSYSHDKLVDPSFSDLVDVFEDLWVNYILVPCRVLLQTEFGDVAAMTVLCSYFEAMAGYVTGENTSGASGNHFVEGFSLVFRADSPEMDVAAKAIYKHIRCGLAHEGMLSHKVSYSRAGARAFYLTYPRRGDGTLNTDAAVASIIVNPMRVYDGVKAHFDGYVGSLREATDKPLCDAFCKTVKRQWGIGISNNVIGMSEAQFLGRA